MVGPGKAVDHDTLSSAPLKWLSQPNLYGGTGCVCVE